MTLQKIADLARRDHRENSGHRHDRVEFVLKIMGWAGKSWSWVDLELMAW